MRIDLYTKAVLTGILGCLMWLCIALTPVGTPVQAQLGPTQVVLAGFQVGTTTHGFDRGLPVMVVHGSAVSPPAPSPSAVWPRRSSRPGWGASWIGAARAG